MSERRCFLGIESQWQVYRVGWTVVFFIGCVLRMGHILSDYECAPSKGFGGAFFGGHASPSFLHNPDCFFNFRKKTTSA